MASGVFTASIMPEVVMQLDSLFVSPDNVTAEFQHPVMTAKLLLERQNVRTEETLQGTICKGVKAWFLQAGVDTVNYDGIVEPSIVDCAIPAGIQMQTNEKDYDNNISIRSIVEIDDGKCDNQLSFEMESAKAMDKAMNDIRVRLNGKAIALLEANVQPHQSGLTLNTDVVGGDALYNPNAYKVAPSKFNYETLLEMQLMARYEQVQVGANRPVTLNVGRNFYTDERVAFYKTGTGTDNGASRVYNTEDIHWDIENRNQLSTNRDTTFIFNPNVVLFWNTNVHNSTTPVLVDTKNGIWEFIMEDPMLMYNKDGVMTPVTYDVSYVYDCTGKTSLGKRKYLHKYEFFLRGGLDVAPAGFNRDAVPVANLTGVMEFVAEV